MKHSATMLVALSLSLSPHCTRSATKSDSGTTATTVDVALQSGPNQLRGVVMRPAGAGPFPVVVYNHGSERDPSLKYLGALGAWFQARGFIAFFPFRRGASGSEGTYWQDVVNARAPADRERATLEQLEAQNDDVLAAIDWIRMQPAVDPTRVAVAGCSFGGIETLLAAERSPLVHAAVDFAGASMSWAKSPLLRERMRVAARSARVPVFFVQAENDFDTTPTLALSEEMQRAQRPHAQHVFPPHGATPMEGHAHFCNHGMDVWGDEVLAFLRRAPS